MSKSANMKSFLICAILPFILTLSASLNLEHNELMDYRLVSKYNNKSSSYVCQTPGTFCDDNCRDRVECVPDGHGGLTEQYLDTCRPSTICINGECTIPPNNPPCSPISDLEFICASIGVFPDPADCKFYHMCARSDPHNTNEPFVHTRIRCEGLPDLYGYNPKTTICDRKLTNKQCGKYPIPLCKGYEVGALAENPTLFYVCREPPHMLGVLYPFQHRCLNGEIFNAAGKSCM